MGIASYDSRFARGSRTAFIILSGFCQLFAIAKSGGQDRIRIRSDYVGDLTFKTFGFQMGDNHHLFMAPKPKNKPERGPIAVIEGKGMKIPIYLSPRRDEESYLLAYYAEGNRKRERISGLEEAKKRARKLIDDLAVGKVHVATFTLKQTMAITGAVEILRPTGVSITEVARQFAEAHNILGNVPSIQAAQFYAKHRKQEVQRGGAAASDSAETGRKIP